MSESCSMPPRGTATGISGCRLCLDRAAATRMRPRNEAGGYGRE